MIGWFYSLLALSLSMTPIILMLLWVAPFLNRRYSSRWRYILWMVIAIRLLLPVSFTDKAAFSIHVPVPATAGPMAVAPLDGQVPTMTMTGLTNADFRLVQILLLFYVVGLLVYIVHGILDNYRFRRDVLRWSRRPSNNIIETLLRQQVQELNIKSDIPVRISKKVTSPMIVGLVRPTLVLPTESYPQAELRMIMTHELVHLQRHDIWFKTIFLAATALHWFNPVVHLMVREANKDMEKSCDDFVLRNADVETKKRYCHLILNLATQKNSNEGPIFSTSISSTRENLETRIRGIFITSEKRRGIAALTSIAMIVAMSGVIVTISHAATLPNGTLQNEYVESSIDAEETIPQLMEDEFDPQGKDLGELDSRLGDSRDNPNTENNGGYPADKQAGAVPDDGNKAEVVVVDLIQLEAALAEQEPTGKSER